MRAVAAAPVEVRRDRDGTGDYGSAECDEEPYPQRCRRSYREDDEADDDGGVGRELVQLLCTGSLSACHSGSVSVRVSAGMRLRVSETPARSTNRCLTQWIHPARRYTARNPVASEKPKQRTQMPPVAGCGQSRFQGKKAGMITAWLMPSTYFHRDAFPKTLPFGSKAMSRSCSVRPQVRTPWSLPRRTPATSPQPLSNWHRK